MPDIIELKPVENLSAAEAEKEGDILLADNQQKQALEYFQHALKLYHEQAQKLEVANIYHKIGTLYSSVKDVENSLSNLLEGLNIVTSLKNENEIIRFYLTIGNFYQELFQFANANENFHAALRIAESINDIARVQTCNYSIGNCYNWMEEKEKALEYLDKVLSSNIEDNLLRLKAFASSGILFYKRKEYNESLKHLTTALEINTVYGTDLLKANILKSLGNVYFLMNDKKKALECLDEAIPITEKTGLTSINSVIYDTYSQIYESLGDHKKALLFLKKKNETEDILRNENVKLKTRELQKKFDIAESQREKEIYRLKNIDLASANEKISLQKIELEEKNRNITDSIFYAGQLQKAILPPEHVLNKYFAEAFIYFQPKDIVSGDFYWFSGKNERFILAAVDCTGHGVPGALMSMMGNNFLSSIVDTEARTDPAEILQEINKRTKASLQNKEASVTANDGMDLALCSIDFKNEMLYFAGAHRPLVYIRDGQLYEIKSDKHSIGGISDFDMAFALHEVKLQKGDTFYIYSDGYADQFGGPKNRKYMAGKLKDFLCEISAKEMSEQQKLLEENHYRWRGDNEQVDDLLVIGFRY